MKNHIIEFNLEFLLLIGLQQYHFIEHSNYIISVIFKVILALNLIYTLHNVVFLYIAIISTSLPYLFFIDSSIYSNSGRFICSVWESYFFIKWFTISIIAIDCTYFHKNKNLANETLKATRYLLSKIYSVVNKSKKPFESNPFPTTTGNKL